jgi:hypothetical protein
MSNDEQIITIRLSAPRLAALRNVIDQMHAFGSSCDDETNKGHWQHYDEGMTDWREDVAFAAESLIDTIQPSRDETEAQ